MKSQTVTGMVPEDGRLADPMYLVLTAAVEACHDHRVSDSTSTHDLPGPVQTSRMGRVLLLGAIVGLLVGGLLTNLGTALIEYDESQTLGAACEHAEATISGAPGGLLVGLAAAAVCLLVRRSRRSVALAALGAAAGAFAALLFVTFLLWPLATNYLPVFVCPY